MAKKPKPRWGFRADADKIPITKEKEKEIAKSIKKTGITLKNNLANRLTESASAISTKCRLHTAVKSSTTFFFTYV